MRVWLMLECGSRYAKPNLISTWQTQHWGWGFVVKGSQESCELVGLQPC